MAHDLRWLAKPFREHDWADPPCPECLVGQLEIEKIDVQEDASSLHLHGHEDWEPDWVHGTFTGWVRCSRTACGQRVAITGDWIVRYTGERRPDFEDFYRLRYARPPLPLTGVLPPATPAAVADRLAEASAVLWADPNAAGNRMRVAVEDLLTSLGVARFTRTSPRKKIVLHERIARFAKANEAVAEILEAVKWIGNQGTHEDTLTVDNVLDGADMFAHALNRVFDAETKALERKVRAVNAKKRVGSPRGATVGSRGRRQKP